MTRALVVTLTFLLLGPLVLAQPDPPPNKRRAEILKRFDKNKNGRLESAERKAAMAWLKENRDKLPPVERRGPGGGFPAGGRGGGRGGRSVQDRVTRVADQFDANKDGKLDRGERDKARAHLTERGRGRGRGRRGGGRGGRGGGTSSNVEPHKVAKESVKHYPDKGLYHGGTLRTFFIDFDKDDWNTELAAFYRTDVEVPATVTVDGKEYKDVGIAYRGNSSYFGVGGKKKSWNLRFDAVHDGQNIYGYRTLNLLNGHSDPSFLRAVMYMHVSRDYMPAHHANLVKLVVNGESWGIYANVQQYNKDFLRDFYGTRRGVRWKIPAGAGSAMRYTEDLEAYKRSFDMKTGSGGEAAWKALQEFTRVLGTVDDEASLRKVLDIDEALWFIALDNVFMDGDGYVSRASDYNLYLDRRGRFHFLPHDSNESFKSGSGGPGSRSYPRDERLTPLFGADMDDRPLIKRLLAIPHLRARYLAHVKTIVDEWLDWDLAIGPMFMAYHDLIDSEVKRDDKCLYGYAAFQTSLEGGEGGRSQSVRDFVEARRAYLVDHESLRGAWPEIEVSVSEKASTSGTATVSVRVKGDVPVDRVLLHTANRRNVPFEAVDLQKTGSGAWVGKLPEVKKGKLRWYVEARATAAGRAVFHPRRAEAAPNIRQARR